MDDENEKRSSRVSKTKAKEKLVVVDDDVDDNDRESSEFEEDVPQTLDDSQPVTYTTKSNKGLFLTRVILKRELHSSFEHSCVVVDYQLKTFKTNLFQKRCRMLTNCVQYFYKRPRSLLWLELFTVSVSRIERILFTSHVQMSSLTWSTGRLNTR